MGLEINSDELRNGDDPIVNGRIPYAAHDGDTTVDRPEQVPDHVVGAVA